MRLPRDVAFGAEVPVTIACSGDVREPVMELIERLAAFPKPSTIEVRDEEPLPERPGL
ncbi:MAG: AbrB/MazE/SpoVT family DNA-binding domain-containing protein [Caulobacteraceae bacterium]|nr:AbrB/MazE/SpoVT family DNA-binding domain-containing protein [Caulobacteraceae bacterium]